MSFIKELLTATYALFLEMAPYLIIGFLFAGILHIFVTSRKIARHLGSHDFLSVFKASLFGIPLPLCSCGVIPASMTLKKEGASQSSIVSFLITTPATGIDSIMATYALLGPVFTIFRVVASFLTGLFAGVISIIMHADPPPVSHEDFEEDRVEEEDDVSDEPMMKRIIGVFHYGFIKLLADINNSLLIGLLLGGLITSLLPDNFFEANIGNQHIEMLVMLIAGIPLYICSTGSIPLASALVLKGMSPGAAFVFLLSGPATNAVTISVVGKELGKKVLFIYVFTIAFCSLGFGYGMNFLYDTFSINPASHIHSGHENEILNIIKIISAAIVGFFLLLSYFRALSQKLSKDLDPSKWLTFHIPEMTCGNCLKKISTILEKDFELSEIRSNLSKKTVSLPRETEKEIEEIIKRLEKAGYNAEIKAESCAGSTCCSN